MSSISSSPEHGAFQLQGRQSLKGDHLQFRISQLLSYLEVKEDSWCWMLWTEGLQDGVDSPLLSGPILIYKAQHELLWLSGTSYSHKFHLLETTMYKEIRILEQIRCHATVLFHSPLFYSLPLHSMLLYLVTRHSSLCGPIPFELGLFILCYSGSFYSISSLPTPSHSILFYSCVEWVLA